MKKELTQLSAKVLAERRDLREVMRLGDKIGIELIYQGVTFTLVIAIADLGKKKLIGEGISRKSTIGDEEYRRETGYNEATVRALEALDKKLRRKSHYIGDKYEG